jgi:endonuclease III
MQNQDNWPKTANDFFENGQYEEAFQLFTKCLERDIEPAVSGLKLGLLLCKMGRRKEGQKYLEKYQIPGVGQQLLKLARKKKIIWPGLSEYTGKRLPKKSANIFFLSAILDYQMNSEHIWDNTKTFVETTIPDPANLWQWVTEHSFGEWKRKEKKYNLHRFPAAHERIWKIGKKIIDDYDGDARKIWRNQTPKKVNNRITELVSGEAIPRMILGALLDTKQIDCSKNNCSGLDVKPDVHVCTVLFRLLYGSKKVIVNAKMRKETIEITRRMYPKLPWKLDAPLYSIGLDPCTAKSPACSECPLTDVCACHHGIDLKNEIANPKLTQSNLTQF